MLSRTVDHLLNNVLASADDYLVAEDALSQAFSCSPDNETGWAKEAQLAKRRAAEVAIAIDGLADRAATALNLSPEIVRKRVAALCEINGYIREGCIERICAIANAYKHDGPLNNKHPINSNDDVLATGASVPTQSLGSRP